MIIKKLELQNIRSYRQASVELPLGRTLFEGDIGSGKSTLLMALEFAFFGLGSETGTSLLRVGTSHGSVSMVFEVDGAEYRVERGLEKVGKRVQQTKGVLSSPDGTLDLAPSELKEKVLEILQFNEAPDPKAQSWIYRYAVYTPQEEMRSVLGLSPDLRLQTLRRAFRIEDYRIAVENATELAREVRRKAGEFGVMAAGVSEWKARLQTLQDQRRTERDRAAENRKEEEAAERDLESLKVEMERLREDELKLEQLNREIGLAEQTIEEQVKVVREESTAAADVESKIESLKVGARALKEHKPPSDLTASELDRKADELERKVEKLAGLEATAKSKTADYHSILERGRCPVCERPVKVGERKEFVSKEKAKRAELRHFGLELEEARRDAKRLRRLSNEFREYLLNKKELARVEDELQHHMKELEREKKRIEGAATKVEEGRKAVKDLEARTKTLVAVSAKLTGLGKDIETAERSQRSLRDDLARSTQKLESMDEKEAEMKEEIARREELGRKKDALQEHAIWLADYFAPTVQLIERSVMQGLNQEFDSLFQKWFGLLIDDAGKEVRVDESFTPIVSQDGYEQAVQYLSGGERTSISLAYRLALNSLVQRVSVAMRSNVLILDEPTDGFSKEQLGNVRQVLDEIECPQLIVVSHEKELESFADQIYKVVKDAGVSRILPGAA